MYLYTYYKYIPHTYMCIIYVYILICAPSLNEIISGLYVVRSTRTTLLTSAYVYVCMCVRAWVDRNILARCIVRGECARRKEEKLLQVDFLRATLLLTYTCSCIRCSSCGVEEYLYNVHVQRERKSTKWGSCF